MCDKSSGERLFMAMVDEDEDGVLVNGDVKEEEMMMVSGRKW